MSRLIALSDYAREVIDALSSEGVRVDQFHPEYAVGQLELSVAAESPVTPPTPRCWSAAPSAPSVSGTRSAPLSRPRWSPKEWQWRSCPSQCLEGRPQPDGRRERAFGLTPDGEAFGAGILNRLPALLAIGAPSVASYLRLVPSHWAGAYACWGLENREAALRMITGSAGSSDWAANLEIKCFDLTANPYLLLAGLLAAGFDGVAARATLPEPVDVDPAALPPDELDRRGIRRLPTSLGESTDALAADSVLRAALGSDLIDSVIAVRRSEVERFDEASAEEIVRAQRWTH